MNTSTIVLIVIFAILVIAIVALYFLGRKAQKRQEEQQAQIEAHKQTYEIKRFRIASNGNRPVTKNASWF